MPNTDDVLLARLNALRKTPINLSQTPTLDAPSTPQRNPDDDDLAARFRNLTPNGAATSTPAHPDLEPTPHNDEDDLTVEELLKELGPEDQWDVDRDEGQRIKDLMREASRALPKEEEEEKGKDVDIEVEATGNVNEEVQEEDDEEAEDRKDEADADDYVQRVLAALEVEKKYAGSEKGEVDDHDDHEEEDRDSGDDKDALSLPSAPTELPSSPAPISENVDDMLSARFASLSLPAPPSFNPSKKPVSIQKSLHPKYTDEDIESWCCICNEDATVKCLGCDGDLYCNECWSQGHGTGPGQERGHKALAYTRDT